MARNQGFWGEVWGDQWDNMGDTATFEFLSGGERDAFQALKQTFERYGLGSLSPKILQMVRQGFDQNTVALMLQETDEYKERFKANEQRRKKGLPVLAPKEYLELERKYHQIMQEAGLPQGFYDSQDDFTKWIADDVSPNEIKKRVDIAADAVDNSDENYVKALRQYGLGKGDLTASILDRDRALPLLQKTVRMAEIGSQAMQQDLTLSKGRAAFFADHGVSGDQANKAYGTIGEALPTAESLSSVYDEDYGQAELENELLAGSSEAAGERKRLASRERGMFAQGGGVGGASLGEETSGQF